MRVPELKFGPLAVFGHDFRFRFWASTFPSEGRRGASLPYGARNENLFGKRRSEINPTKLIDPSFCRSWHWLRISLMIETCHLTAILLLSSHGFHRARTQGQESFSQGCTSRWREAFQLQESFKFVSNCLHSQRSLHLKDLSWEVQWHRAQRSDQKGTATWIRVTSWCNDSQIT